MKILNVFVPKMQAWRSIQGGRSAFDLLGIGSRTTGNLPEQRPDKSDTLVSSMRLAILLWEEHSYLNSKVCKRRGSWDTPNRIRTLQACMEAFDIRGARC